MAGGNQRVLRGVLKQLWYSAVTPQVLLGGTLPQQEPRFERSAKGAADTTRRTLSSTAGRLCHDRVRAHHADLDWTAALYSTQANFVPVRIVQDWYFPRTPEPCSNQIALIHSFCNGFLFDAFAAFLQTNPGYE